MVDGGVSQVLSHVHSQNDHASHGGMEISQHQLHHQDPNSHIQGGLPGMHNPNVHSHQQQLDMHGMHPSNHRSHSQVSMHSVHTGDVHGHQQTPMHGMHAPPEQHHSQSLHSMHSQNTQAHQDTSIHVHSQEGHLHHQVGMHVVHVPEAHSHQQPPPMHLLHTQEGLPHSQAHLHGVHLSEGHVHSHPQAEVHDDEHHAHQQGVEDDDVDGDDGPGEDGIDEDGNPAAEGAMTVPEGRSAGTTQLTLSYQGEVYVFDTVHPEKVQAVLLLLGGREIPAGMGGVSHMSQHQKGLMELPARMNLPQRLASLTRFREKRKERCYDKKIRYTVRKEVAQRMHRKKGQFASSRPVGEDGNPVAGYGSESGSGDGSVNPNAPEITCHHCGIGERSTPMMRRGPSGPRSLCNACGLMWANKGILRDLAKGVGSGGGQQQPQMIAQQQIIMQQQQQIAALQQGLHHNLGQQQHSDVDNGPSQGLTLADVLRPQGPGIPLQLDDASPGPSQTKDDMHGVLPHGKLGS